MADCRPVGRRFAPAPLHAAFDTFLLCRTSSTFANNKFDGYHLKICSTPVSFGPASPDAGVELLRQLFLQCMQYRCTRVVLRNVRALYFQTWLFFLLYSKVYFEKYYCVVFT